MRMNGTWPRYAIVNRKLPRYSNVFVDSCFAFLGVTKIRYAVTSLHVVCYVANTDIEQF